MPGKKTKAIPIKDSTVNVDGKTHILTDREVIFCNEFLKHRNASKAMINAGYTGTAFAVEASNYLKKPKIKEYIRLHSEKVIHRVGVEQDQIVRELARLGFSNVFDVFEDDFSLKDKANISNGTQRAVSGLKVTKKKVVMDGKEETTTDVTVKMWDKIKPLVHLAEMAGLINTEPKTNVQVNNYIQNLTENYE